MSKQHQPSWREAGIFLQKTLEEYQAIKGYNHFTRAIHDIANAMPGRDGGGLSSKTVRRDLAGESIPERRVELYVQWFYEKVRLSRQRIAEWLEYTAYPRPGELLARVCDAGGDRQKLYESVKRYGMPALRGRLWGRFLERKEVMEKAIQWADNRRHPIAVLWGFGGNGKTIIQLKLGEDFVYNRDCPLRWPFEGVVWVSAIDFPRGQPSLIDILRKIAEALEIDDPANLERVSPAWLRQEVERFLKKNRLLILLDNFETVSETNREEILKFFSWLGGSTQTLISSRHHFDLHDIAHVLILVDGLLPEQAETLIDDYLHTQSLSRSAFDPADFNRLATLTLNNPKTILTVLGMVEKGIALPDLLNSISQGSPEADDIFKTIIDTAWQELLKEEDKTVLMAKSFFNQPIGNRALGKVASVGGNKLLQAIKTLQTISFFDRTQGEDTRVRAHPLAQDFAYSVLRDHPEFESQAEQRWWSEYAPLVVEQARRATHTHLQAKPALADDITNVLDHLERHLCKHTSYSTQAAEMFAGRKGLGYALRQLDKWNEVLRVAEMSLHLAIEQHNPRLIGECALNLISTVYRERNQLDKAEQYVARATEQNVTLNDAWLQAAIVLERAQIYRRSGRFIAAKQTFQHALDLFLKIDEIPDIANTFVLLGGITMAIATENLGEAVDPHWQENPVWMEVEDYFRRAEYYWSQIDATDPVRRFDNGTISAYRGTAARLRGDLDAARQFFNECTEQFQSLTSVARLHRELALVEHLAGNKDLAYQHEENGLNLQKQLGISSTLQPYDCYKIIEKMKEAGTW